MKSVERKRIVKCEDQNLDRLRRWCIRVRSLVLVPSLEKQAEEARPHPKGTLSPPMVSAMSDANALGISDMPDVNAMLNAFKCMSWPLFTLSIIKRKPGFPEID